MPYMDRHKLWKKDIFFEPRHQWTPTNEFSCQKNAHAADADCDTSFVQHETYSYTPKNEKMYSALTAFLFSQWLPSSCFVEISYLHNFNSFLSSFLSSKLAEQ